VPSNGRPLEEEEEEKKKRWSLFLIRLHIFSTLIFFLIHGTGRPCPETMSNNMVFARIMGLTVLIVLDIVGLTVLIVLDKCNFHYRHPDTTVYYAHQHKFSGSLV
jgi:hypothetical protein